MSLKQRIKEKIYSPHLMANYPLEEFISWAGRIPQVGALLTNFT